MHFSIVSTNTLWFTRHDNLQCIRASIHTTARDARTGMIKEDDRHFTIHLWLQKRTLHTFVKYVDGEPIQTATAIKDRVVGEGKPIEIWRLADEVAELAAGLDTEEETDFRQDRRPTRDGVGEAAGEGTDQGCWDQRQGTKVTMFVQKTNGCEGARAAQRL